MRLLRQRIVMVLIITASMEAMRAQGPTLVVTSGASFELGLPPKGSIASIFCTGLTGIDQNVPAKSLPLPTELAGVRVKIDGVLAPLFSITPLQNTFQINLQVPAEGNNGGRPAIQIEQGSTVFSAFSAVRIGPGDFFRSTDGIGIFQHAGDYSLVTADNPARAGDSLIGYLTGLPGAQPAVPLGEPSPASPLSLIPGRCLPDQLHDACGSWWSRASSVGAVFLHRIFRLMQQWGRF